MTISALNRRWRPPLLAAIWGAALILLWIDLSWLHMAAATALGVFVLASLLDARRETLAVVALIAVIGGLLLWSGAPASELVRGLDRTLIFAGLLPTLALTRAVARGLVAVRTAQHRIAALPPRMSGIGLLFGAHAFGSILNTGAFAMMGAVVPDDAPEPNRRAAALVTLRGMNSVALYSPFFVGFAVAYTYLPDVPVWQVFVLGTGIAACGLFVSLLLFARPLSRRAVAQGLSCLAPVALPMAGIAGLVVVASQVFPISTLGAVVMVMPILAAMHLARHPYKAGPVVAETRASMARMGDDLAIVSAAMVLGTLAESAPPVGEVLAPWIATHLPTSATFAATALSMIGLAVVGVHPMITGTVMMVAITGSDLPVADLPLMMAMLFGWGFGSMNSISSLSVATAGQMFAVRPLTLAFGPNLIFALVVGVIAIGFLTGLNAVLVR